MSHIFNNAEPGSQLIWTVMILPTNSLWRLFSRFKASDAPAAHFLTIQ
jgi:hypothetical protein